MWGSHSLTMVSMRRSSWAMRAGSSLAQSAERSFLSSVLKRRLLLALERGDRALGLDGFGAGRVSEPGAGMLR